MHSQRLIDCVLQIDVDSCVRVVAPVTDQSMTQGLRQRVSVASSKLQQISQAAVEITLVSGIHPEANESHRQQIIDEFRNRAVDFLHHLPQLFTAEQVSDAVVVIIQQ